MQSKEERMSKVNDVLQDIQWGETDERLEDLLIQSASWKNEPLDQGFEAEVVKLCAGQERFVFKIWNKHAKPDAAFQFRLLQTLSKLGLAVSRPYGWGKDSGGNPVLLTSYDGTGIRQVDDRKMSGLARILASIHQVPVETLASIGLPVYDFVGYVYPGITDFPDLEQAAHELAGEADLRQERLIHGDYHLANILEKNGAFTIIDWTNGQLGDPRYDLAWSLALCRLYVSDYDADVFLAAYLSQLALDREELDLFEALAMIRWRLLNRRGGVPMESRTKDRVKAIVSRNAYLLKILSSFQD